MINLELSENERKNLSEDEIELAKARKLEILLIPIIRRNFQFFYAGGDLKGKAKAYRETLSKEKLESGLKSKNKNIATVCKPLCETVSEILRDNGIKATTVSCDTDMFRHTDVLLETKNGKKYIINYLEDIERIQTGMDTPDFASEPYYIRRYKKFNDNNAITTDGKNIAEIAFLTSDELRKIDNALGYTQHNMYMNDVINQIKNEFSNYRKIMAENECVSAKIDTNEEYTDEQKAKAKKEIYDKYSKMTEDEILESKIDWLFNYFNDRMSIKGHTDFVMFYSRLLLKEVLTDEEYSKINRYDCFINMKKLPKENIIDEVLDKDNPDNSVKSYFCVLELGDNFYIFSTKPNEYKKLDKKQFEELSQYANISKSEKPTDLMLYLCDRGNALPLVFHPLGSKILNDRAELIDKNLSPEERIKAIEELSKQIITTDEPVTSILIPYADGKSKYLYINENDEFVIKENNKETIYHYDKENDKFDIEENDFEER